ncbi:hypothetical protein C8F01DRAFT_1318208 [Mycena amicta]|nr:hypothetical protein C8F01DRAFT_1318208 [Mycena amicta]
MCDYGDQDVASTPVTVKLRTGVKDRRNTVHKLMPRMLGDGAGGEEMTGERGWGGSSNGRGSCTGGDATGQQRYTKLADWQYIKTCVDALSFPNSDDAASLPVPRMRTSHASRSSGTATAIPEPRTGTRSSGVDGVMVARGALIKPWIFTEIKGSYLCLVSSHVHILTIRQNVESGTSACASGWRVLGTMPSMDYHTLAPTPPRSTLLGGTSVKHFPSNTATSRSALGILERLPVKLNERDELETLLASGDSRDWMHISEMFLGAPPETWGFTPKHQSSAYESQG